MPSRTQRAADRPLPPRRRRDRRRALATALVLASAPAPTAGFGPGPAAGAARRRDAGVGVRDAPDFCSGGGDGRDRGAGAEAGVIRNGALPRRREVLSMAGVLAVPFLLGVPSALAEDPASTAEVEEPAECRKGGIMSESAVPGAYQQACMDLDERRFPLKTTGETITVYQGTTSAGGMAGRTGIAVWNSGVLLTRLLDALCRSNPSLFQDKTVFELGCGAALASIAAAKLGAAAVIATDANPEVLALAERNIARNDVAKVTVARPLQWGLLNAYEYENRADVLLGSDLTYNSGSWVALAETMATVLKPDGVVVYLSLGHAGFNVGGEMGGFLSVAGNLGLRVLTKDSPEWADRVGRQSTEALLASVLSPAERQAIEAGGGVRAVFLGRKPAGRRG